MSYRFFGHSDDCVEVEGSDGLRREVGAYDAAVRWRVGSGDAGLFVTAEYADSGVWAFRLEQVDDGVRMPWGVSVDVEHEYSLAVVVDCPVGTPLSYSTWSVFDGWGDEVQVVPEPAR